MVAWPTGGEGEGDALPGPANATMPLAVTQWLRADPVPSFHSKLTHDGCDQTHVAAHCDGLSRLRQKRRRGNAATAALSCAQQGDRAEAMSVALLDDAEEGGTVVSRTSHDDVDMGTPTAANATNASWKDADTTRDDERERIRELPYAAGSEPDAQTPQSSGVELAAFREYNDADIDSLEILPSQDFGGGISEDEDRVATSQPVVRSAPLDSCAWHDFPEGTQQQEEEASEVFDNVIYAPRSTRPQALQVTTPPQRPLADVDDMYESESELSDGFEVSLSFAPVVPGPNSSKSKSSTTPLPAHSDTSRASSTNSSPPASSSSHQWHARLSVKRDCSFIDCTAPKKQPHAEARVEELSESSEEFGVKLKLVDKDEDDAGIDRPTSIKPSTSTSTSITTTEALKTESSVPEGFYPRKKKRRKVRQLPLDAFLKAQPSTS